jgi:hypothetical protein
MNACCDEIVEEKYINAHTPTLICECLCNIDLLQVWKHEVNKFPKLLKQNPSVQNKLLGRG